MRPRVFPWLLTLWLSLLIPGMASSQSWHVETVDSIGDEGNWSSLGFDLAGRPQISYYDAVAHHLKFTSWDGNHWVFQTIDASPGVGQFTSLDTDLQGYAHIGYFDSTDENLKYAYWSGSQWMVETEIADKDDQVGSYTSLRLDAQGNAHVSYYDIGNDNLKYAVRDTIGWTVQPLVWVDKVGKWSSLDLDPSATPFISYWNFTQGDLNMSSWNGTRWSNEVVDSTSPLTGFTTSLRLDREGRPHISYFDSTNSDLRYASWNGASWVLESVDTVGHVGVYTSLVLDSLDRPHISYFDMTSSALKYAYWNGSSWVVQMIDNKAGGGGWTSLKFDPQGIPHISYYKYKPPTSEFTLKYAYAIPDLQVSTASHDFGSVGVGSSSTWSLKVWNLSMIPLRLDSVSPAGDVFRVLSPMFPQTISQGETLTVLVQFTPPAVGAYSAPLVIYNNDPDEVAKSISLSGQGSGIAAFSGRVYDVSVDTSSGTLNSQVPLEGVKVELLKDGQVRYGPILTQAGGQFIFSGIDADTYSVHASQVVILPDSLPIRSFLVTRDTVNVYRTMFIDLGSNELDLFLPVSLVSQKYGLIVDLSAISISGLNLGTGYSEGNTQTLLNSWTGSLDTVRMGTLPRLVASEVGLSGFLGQASRIGGEATSGIGDLLFSVLGLRRGLEDLGSALGENSQAQELVDSLGWIWAHHVGRLTGIPLEGGAALLDSVAADALKNGYYSSFLGAASRDQNREGDLARALMLEAVGAATDSFYRPWLGESYVHNQTQSSLDRAQDYASALEYSGTFADAYLSFGRILSGVDDSVGAVMNYSQGIRTAARTWDLVSALVSRLPATGAVEALSSLQAPVGGMGFAAYGSVFESCGRSFSWIPTQVALAIDSIYHPGVTAVGTTPQERDLARSSRIGRTRSARRSPASESTLAPPPSGAAYDSLLERIGAAVTAGDADQVRSLGNTLPRYDLALDQELYTSICQVMSRARVGVDSVSGFVALYDTMLARQQQSLRDRFLLGLDLLAYVLSPGQEQKDALLAQVALTPTVNDSAFSAAAVLQDSLALPSSLPALGVLSTVSSQSVLQPNNRLTIVATIANLSTSPIVGASVSLRTTPSLRLVSPAVQALGTIEPRGERVVNWTLEARAGTSNMGAWVLQATAPAATIFSQAGFVSITGGSTPPTGGKLDSKHVYCYKNPFNPEAEETHVRFSLPATDRVSVEVRDAGGMLVKKLMRDQMLEGILEQEISWDGRNGKGTVVANGMYFVIIETSGGERGVAKVAVLR